MMHIFNPFDMTSSFWNQIIKLIKQVVFYTEDLNGIEEFSGTGMHPIDVNCRLAPFVNIIKNNKTSLVSTI